MIQDLVITIVIFFILIFVLHKIIAILPPNEKKYIKAIAIVDPHTPHTPPTSPHNNSKFKHIQGSVVFEELSSGNTKIKGHITGFPPDLYGTKHGFHIHETGDLREGCKSLKGHYNPFGKDHGGRLTTDNWGRPKINFDRHVGDLGNIEVDNNGVAKFEFEDPLIQLSGPINVIGRSVVFHEGQDDLGLGGHEDSRTTGHAGARIGCGIIGRQ